MNTSTSPKRPLLAFFVLVFALSLLVELFGPLTEHFSARLPIVISSGFEPSIAWAMIQPFSVVVVLIEVIGEEVGWTGYVTDPLQERWGALQAGLILGAVRGMRQNRIEVPTGGCCGSAVAPACERTCRHSVPNDFRVARKYVLTPGGIRHYLAHLRQFKLQHTYHTQSAEKGQACVIEVTPFDASVLTAEPFG